MVIAALRVSRLVRLLLVAVIAGVSLPSQPQVGTRYRLRFRVSGTSPVILQGWVDQYANGAWTLWASGQTQHTNATQRDPNLYCDAAGMPPPRNDWRSSS